MERHSGLLIDINSAREEDLTQLPRIGADRARHIIRHRMIRKGFRDWQDFAETLEIPAEDIAAIRTMAWIGPRSDALSAREPRRTPRDVQPVRRPQPRPRSR